MELLFRGLGLSSFSLVLVLLAPLMSAQADTIIDVQARGMNSRLMMNESFARVDNSADGGYLLLDRHTNQSYQVMPSTKQIMPMRLETESKAASRLQIELVPRQNRQLRLQGYPTQSYDLFANRKHCGTVMASHEAVSNLKLGKLLGAASEMIDQQLAAMGPYIVVIDNCLQASMRLLTYVDRIGLPLRVHDAKGVLLSDVVNIDTRAEIDQQLLTLPADYQRVDSVKQLSPTQKVLQQVRRASPAVNDALRSAGQYFYGRPQQYR